MALPEDQQALRLLEQHGTIAAAALAAGIPRTTMRYRIHAARAQGKAAPSFIVDPAPDEDLSIDEILSLKRKVLDRKVRKSKWASLIPVQVKLEGPVCIGVFGDPHVDDDSCDIHTLEKDLKVITDHRYMLGLDIGDITNNWVGRLAKKYADQMATKSQALKLAEWLLDPSRNWLAHVLGNHDLWEGSDVIRLLSRHTGAVDQAHGVRMQLSFPDGDPIRIHARHDFPGNSIHNPTHALKRELEHGYRDHIMVAGHRHIDGYQIFPNMADGIVSHLARVSGYKIIDDYAEMNRFIEMRMNPSIWWVLNPTHPKQAERIKPYWDSEEAQDITAYLRKRAGL